MAYQSLAPTQAPGQSTPYNAMDITYAPLPRLQEAPSKTLGRATSTHSKLIGRVTHWATFEQEVRYYTNQHLAPTAPPIHYVTRDMLHFCDRETVLCATEQGVVSRFHQQVSHTMNDVAHSLGLGYTLGDWYNNQNATLLPDIAIWDRGTAPFSTVIAGEAKTPWTQLDWPHIIVPASNTLTGPAVHSIAQIAGYMDAFNLRYGFLTSYEMTYCLERRPSTDDSNAMVLAISNGIRFDQPSSPTTGAVSTRECMLGLMLMVQTNGSSPDSRRRRPITSTSGGKSKFGWNRPNDGSTFGGPGSGGSLQALGPGPGSSRGHQAQTSHASHYSGSSVTYGKQGYSSRDLTADFDRLQVQRTQQKIDTRLEARWHEKKKQWYWSDHRQKDWYPVKKFEWYRTEKGERLHFKIEGAYRPTKMIR